MAPAGRPIAIFGSCVSRDPFSFLQVTDWPIAPYIARQSFIGIADPPLAFDPMWYKKMKAFEARCIASDLSKTALRILASRKPSVLILDFIDERFDLLQIGDTRVSDTRHMRQPGFRQRYESRWTPIPRLSEETTELWKTGAEIFMKGAADIVGEENIIIHEATWAPALRMPDGSLEPFDEPYLSLIPRHNALLEQYFAHMRALAPKAKTLRVAQHNVLADPEHRWSREPFHYVQEYYVDFMERFRKLMPTMHPAVTTTGG
ncbi:MAG TPA: DUF6270 domain-containing protein [Rhizomicrobium sp.]